MSRAGALSKRLLLRGNPTTSPLFPKPSHGHFPEQSACTETVIQHLCSELVAAQQQARKVEACAKEYRASLEAVKQVEAIRKTAADLVSNFESLTGQLENGVTTSAGDGSTPDLSTESCLDQTRHSVFLSLFPSIVHQLERANNEATPLIARARTALLHLDFPGVDAQFQAESAAAIDALESSQAAATRARDSISSRIATLSQVRKVWSSMDALFHEAEEVRDEILDAMSRQMWRQQVRHEAPPTPESPSTTLPAVPISPDEVHDRLLQLCVRVKDDISAPLSALAPGLTPPLREYLIHSSSTLEAILNSTSDTARFWEAVQKQATMMCAVRDDVHSFQIRIEDLKVRYDKATQDVSTSTLDDQAIAHTEEELSGDLASTRSDIQSFLDLLPSRVPFVDQVKFIGVVDRAATKRRQSVGGGFSLSVLQQAAQPSLPFDPAALDKGVRTDSNTYSMMLSGAVKALDTKADQFQLAKKAHAVDVTLLPLLDELGKASDAVTSIQVSLTEGEGRLPADRLAELSTELDQATKAHEPILERALSPARAALQTLRSAAGSPEVSARDAIVSARQKAVENAEAEFVSWKKGAATLKQQITEAHKTEMHRLAEEARLREEQERLEAEAAALRAREEAAAAEAERLAALERARLEREKVEAAERARVERERAEAEERERQERLAREKADAEERERRRMAEEEERARREAEEKARREREAAERKAQEERERLARERAERERIEAIERERLVREKAEAEERARLERERAKAEEREIRERQEAVERAEREELERRRLEALRLAEESAIMDSPLETVEELSFSMDGRLWQNIVPWSGHTNLRVADVFTVRQSSKPATGLSPHMTELSSKIFSFRKRLRSIGINQVARPKSRSSSPLPDEETCKSMSKTFSALCKDVATLPASVPQEPVVDADLRSLRSEMEASKEMMFRVNNLGDFAALLRDCDEALSDLLEHIDSYPSPPIGPLSAAHKPNHSLTPEEQLSARLTFTRDVLARMKTLARALKDDRRIPAEHERILQTWTELEAMALDRINGQKSRPSSVISSGRSSRVSVIQSSSHLKESPRVRASLDVPRPRQSLDKKGSFSKLSASPGKFLTPPPPNPNARRAASGPSVGTGTPRSSSRLSIASSSRSVSGPMSGSGTSSSSTLFGSTYSSRQRTSSVTSNTSSLASPPILKRVLPNLPTSRPRAQTGTTRTSSPAISDASFSGRSSLNLPRPPSTHSTWSRAPRLSFTSQTKSPPRVQAPRPIRKPYVANPKNKLDVAVGDVLNKLPVEIKVELVADTWKDQSGKYWIGDTDPKLCFCRILRSQTVMVRVGGGWQELSRRVSFLKVVDRC